MAVAPVRPETVTGVVELVPKPQHRAVPSAMRAHVWLPPAVMATAPVRPVTVTGVVELVVVPLPSCPEVFAPQQRAVPSSTSAHVCASPAVMAV